mmetsp:Transcript_46235/g.117348  ORF Transcript_46235/g.117348 Transcript_46235/m.117348 type:complete len:259 (-) Transcript_46235:180-956(-)
MQALLLLPSWPLRKWLRLPVLPLRPREAQAPQQEEQGRQVDVLSAARIHGPISCHGDAQPLYGDAVPGLLCRCHHGRLTVWPPRGPVWAVRAGDADDHGPGLSSRIPGFNDVAGHAAAAASAATAAPAPAAAVHPVWCTDGAHDGPRWDARHGSSRHRWLLHGAADAGDAAHSDAHGAPRHGHVWRATAPAATLPAAAGHLAGARMHVPAASPPAAAADAVCADRGAVGPALARARGRGHVPAPAAGGRPELLMASGR